MARRREYKAISLFVLILLAATHTIAGYKSLCSPENGWKTVFSDEFNGTKLDDTKWTARDRSEWGPYYPKPLLAYYTPLNVKVVDGSMTIEARREEYKGFNYTSGYVSSQHKVDVLYGRICIRASLPLQNFPGLWMMPDNPMCYQGRSEIDVLEMVHGNGQAHGSLHFDITEYNSTTPPCRDSVYMTCTGIKQVQNYTDFHEYAIEWTNESVTYFVDSQPYVSCVQDGHRTFVPRHSHYFIFDLAIGGWGGTPSSTMLFPQYLKLDYVRVSQHPSLGELIRHSRDRVSQDNEEIAVPAYPRSLQMLENED